MANPFRGQLAFSAGGNSYTMSFSIGALCSLEAALSKPLSAIVGQMADDCPHHVVRHLLWAALRDHHDDIALCKAGDIVEVAGPAAVLKAVSDCLALASPQSDSRRARGEGTLIDPLPLLRMWTSCDLDPAVFWRLTFREVYAIIDGAKARLIREHNDRAWLAWHVAALGRANRLPRLKNLLHETKGAARRQTIDEQIAIARMWHVAVTRH